MAFISLVLPWWTWTASFEALDTVSTSAGLSVYPYQTTTYATGMGSVTVSMDLWFGWAALSLIIIAGIVGILGSVMVGKTGKMILIVAGILALISILVFAIGLNNELSKAPVVQGFPEVGLFSRGSFTLFDVSMNYSSYLTFGFWLALVAAIIAFISSLKHPVTPTED